MRTHQQRSRGRRGRLIGGLLALLVALGALVITPATPAAADRLSPTRPAPCGGKYQTRYPFLRGSMSTCVLSEDFTGSRLNPRIWTVQETATSAFSSGPDACFVDSPNNVQVADGKLRLTARKEADPFFCPGILGWNPADPTPVQHTSGSITSSGRFSQAYGRFEISAKMPNVAVPGVQFSWWLWPETSAYGPNHYVQGVGYVPNSGELDVMEWYSQYSTQGIPAIHYVGDAADPKVTEYYSPACRPTGMSTGFHTYTLEWTPTTLRFFYDGHLCLENKNWNPTNGISKPAPFDKAFNLNLTQALGIDTNVFNPSTTPLPATTEIEYVYVWK